MTNEQLYLVIGAPMLFNAVLMGLMMAYMNAKFDAVYERFRSVDQRFETVDKRFENIDKRFDSLNKRFDDMRDLWRSELHRVEEVLDARLKHLEER
jgi:DNA anti-recombination protein RmuC